MLHILVLPGFIRLIIQIKVIYKNLTNIMRNWGKQRPR